MEAAIPKPNILTINVAGIPQELQARPQWVVWNLELNQRKDKYTKVPYIAGTQLRNKASSTNPATWANFEVALADYRQGVGSGIGYMFAAGDPYCGVDIDDAFDEAGQPKSKTLDIIYTLESYTELSPSGRGIHIIVKASKPEGSSKVGDYEMYEQARYFTITGVLLDADEASLATINERQDALNDVHTRYFAQEKPQAKQAPASTFVPQQIALPDDDEELKTMMFNARNGQKTWDLWHGRWEGHFKSQSQADMSLCCVLAFWANSDTGRMDRLFRQSGLYRSEKWDSRHYANGDTYGQRTIKNAVGFEASNARVHFNDTTWEPNASELVELLGRQNLRQFPTQRIDEETGEISDESDAEQTDDPQAVSIDNKVIQLYANNRKWPDPLEPMAYYGIVGEIVSAIAPQTEADPAAVLITLLAGLGNIIGRGAYAKVGATRHGINLFAAIVGETGLGRKGTSWDAVNELLVAVEQEWAKRIQGGGLSSGEGVIWAVRDRIEKLTQARDNRNKPIPDQFVNELVDPGIDDKRLFIIETEFAGTLRVMTRDGNTLSPVLRNAWDGSNLSALTKNSPARSTEPHISIIGHITPTELAQCLSESESSNGFANRFLWVCSKLSKYLPEGGDPPVYGDALERLIRAVQYGQTAGQLSRTDQAKEEWAKLYPRLTSGQPGLLGMVTGRAAAQVLRLSTLYAVLDEAPAIDLEHLTAAMAVWDYCEASAKYIFGDATGDIIADKILGNLRQSPDGMTRSDIHKLFGNHAPMKRIEQALQLLVQLKRAFPSMVKTAGRSLEWWQAS